MSAEVIKASDLTATIHIQAEGITLADLSPSVPVPLKIQHLDVNTEGEAEITVKKAIFYLRQMDAAESDIVEVTRLLNGNRAEGLRHTNLVRLSALLVNEPTGFADFPADARPLSLRAYTYFNNPAADEAVETILKGYDVLRTLQFSDVLFRVIPSPDRQPD